MIHFAVGFLSTQEGLQYTTSRHHHRHYLRHCHRHLFLGTHFSQDSEGHQLW